MKYSLNKLDPLDEQIYTSSSKAIVSYQSDIYVLDGSTTDNAFFYKIHPADMSLESIELTLDPFSSSVFFGKDIKSLGLTASLNAVLDGHVFTTVASIDTGQCQGYVLVQIDLATYVTTLTIFRTTLGLNINLLSVWGILSNRLFLFGKDTYADVYNQIFIYDLTLKTITSVTVGASSLSGGQTFILSGTTVYAIGGKQINSLNGIEYDVENIIYKFNIGVSPITLTQKQIPLNSTYLVPTPLVNAPAFSDGTSIFILDQDHTPPRTYKISIAILSVIGFKETTSDIAANSAVAYGSNVLYLDTRTSQVWTENIPVLAGDNGPVGGSPSPTGQVITLFDHSCKYNGDVLMNERADEKIDGRTFLTIYR